MPTSGYDSWKTRTPDESYRCQYTTFAGVCGASTEEYGAQLKGEDYCLPHLAAMLDSENPASINFNGTLSVSDDVRRALEEAVFWAESTGRRYDLYVRLDVSDETTEPVCKYSNGGLHGHPSRVRIDDHEEWLCIDCTNAAIRAGRRVA